MRDLKFSRKKSKKDPKLNITDIAWYGINSELFPIIHKIKENKNDQDLVKFLKNYFILHFVTCLEVFFRDLVIKLIDRYGKSLDGLFDKKSVEEIIKKFEIEIRNGEITKGSIIASELNFQKTSDINEVLSLLIGHDFLKLINKTKIDPTTNPYEKNWDKLLGLIDKRHDIIHNLDYNVSLGNKELENIAYATEAFTAVVNNRVFLPIHLQSPEKLQNNNPKLHRWFILNYRKVKKS